MSDISRVPTCHLIINFHIKLTVPASQIPVTLCVDEVEDGAWLTSEQITKVFGKVDPD